RPGHADDLHRVLAPGEQHPLAERAATRRALPARDRGRAGALLEPGEALDGGLGDEPVSPERSHLVDDREQRLTLVRELVLDAGRRLLVAWAHEVRHLLEWAQALGAWTLAVA